MQDQLPEGLAPAGPPESSPPGTVRELSVSRYLAQQAAEVLETVLPALVIVVVINLFLAQATRVEGQSMEPNLHDNQRLIIEKVSYYLHPPQRGDIVVLRLPNRRTDPLIKRVIGLPGETLEIKIFGGANVTETSSAIGTANAEFALRYLEAEGLRCVAQDLGGRLPRRIHYSPATGKVTRRLLGGSESFAVMREENEYASRLLQRVPAGEIELFLE